MRSMLVIVLLAFSGTLLAQRVTKYQLTSPDQKIVISVNTGKDVSWSISHEQTPILVPSDISLSLLNGETLGKNPVVLNAKTSSSNTVITAPIYKKRKVVDHYNELVLNCKGNYKIVFRAYNDGAAYRFVTNRKDSLLIASEQADFNFDADYKAFIPYVRDLRVPGDQFISSFEALYEEINISEFAKDTLAFLPLLVELNEGKKAVIVEADLEDYPGMFINVNKGGRVGLKGVFAPYPLTEETGGFHNINYIVGRRANYIAQTVGARSFPWRAVVISSHDKELADNDMVYKLSAPSRVNDMTWIKPGKVSWDWWNDWNISGVDFRAGINTPTYKYYIDFAAANQLEYIVMDEGWSDASDLTKTSANIDLEEIVNYGKQRNVGVILWASWYALTRRMDEVFEKYSMMGVKGFKIDFLDRDDQKMVSSTYEIAKKAAEYNLLINFHGMYKPGGIQRTYPNVLNFEGVKGLENVKWTPDDDVPRYDVSIPFIRMLAGPMDYTPGAMRNSNKTGFRYSHSMPMSQGTRCHQIAMYTVFDAPMQMLADNPTAYMKERESTSFIAKIPTTFDETIALDGKVGEYVAIARRKGDVWFVGAMTNWNTRDLEIGFSFLGAGDYEAEIFKDGINADRDATDYKREVKKVSRNDKHTIRLSSGGGWSARIYPAK